jgi:glutaredoxin
MTRPNALALLACAGLLLTGAAQAQVYRSVGPDGRVTYSDRPPATGGHATEGSAAAGSSGRSDSGALPYQLNQVTQRYPVTLYTASNCAPCDSGRNLLIGRGIPFSEKTVQSSDDIAALHQLSGGNELPVLTIGQQRINGYTSQEWSQYLDAAGYPPTSQLPSGYRHPPATPLVAAQPASAPQPEASDAATEQPEHAPSVTPAYDVHNPAGIQF